MYIILWIDEKLDWEKTVKSLTSEKVTTEDQKKIDTYMLDLEYGSMKLMNSFTSKILEKFNGVKESWNIEAKLHIDDESIGMIDSLLQLTNFESKSKGFDSSLKGNVDFLLHSLSSDASKSVDVKLKWFFDLISKESSGDTFLYLDNFIAEYPKDNTGIQEYISALTTLADAKKYVRLDSSSTSELSQAKSLLWFIWSISNVDKRQNYTSLFWGNVYTVYKKVWNTYYLKKDAKKECKNAIAFTQKILGSAPIEVDCDVEEESKNIYVLNAEDPNSIIFSTLTSTTDTFVHQEVVFNTTELKRSTYASYSAFKNTYVSYTKGKEVAMVFADESHPYALFRGQLNNMNYFTSFDANINVERVFDLNAHLKDKLLTWTFNGYISKYDWATNTQKSTKVLSGTISWETDTSDAMKLVTIKAKGGAIASESDVFDMSFVYTPSTLDTSIFYDYSQMFTLWMNHSATMSGEMKTWLAIDQDLKIEVSKNGKQVGLFELVANMVSKTDSKIEIISPKDFIEIGELLQVTQDAELEEIEEIFE